MAIATIINGRDERPDERRTTLIVVTPSIIMQWQAELTKRTRQKELGKVYRYNAGQKIGTGDPEEDVRRLLRNDIV